MQPGFFRTAGTMSQQPLFTVIIFCEHDAAGLERALAALTCQTGLGHPVEILVLDPTGDAGRDRAAAAGSARRIVPGSAERAGAWNEGLQQANGRWVAFTDDDCEPEPDWLGRLGEALADGATLAGGPDRAPADLPRFLRHLDYVLNSPAGTAGLRAGNRRGDWYPRHWNLAGDRSAILAAGGFTGALPEAWELDLDRRVRAAGGRTAFVPDAVVVHRRETTPARFFARNVRLARSRAARGARRLIFALPFLGAAGLILLTVVSVWIPAARLPLALAVSGYLAVLAGAGVHAAATLRDPAALAGVPLLLLVQHLSHAAGFLIGLLRRDPPGPPDPGIESGFGTLPRSGAS